MENPQTSLYFIKEEPTTFTSQEARLQRCTDNKCLKEKRKYGELEDSCLHSPSLGMMGRLLIQLDNSVSVSPKKRKYDRYNGISENDVAKRTLPDHLAENLDIIFIGINPGLTSAYRGHHYAGPSNHFWKCLSASGLTNKLYSAYDDYKLLNSGIGFTNIIERATKSSSELTKQEYKEGSIILKAKLQKFRPKIAVFNGKIIYEVFSGKKKFNYGKQPELIEGTDTYVWVMPSSSARFALLPRFEDKVPFYIALKKFCEYLNGSNSTIDETELVFPPEMFYRKRKR